VRNPLCRLAPSVRVYGGFRDSFACFGPPGSGKSVFMAGVGLDAPGAVLFTSTRADMADHTALPRSRKGPVYFLNPGGEGGYPSTLRWSPLAGCQAPQMAMEAAGALIHASPRDPGGKDAHWDHQSKDMLQFLMHAAAVMGEDIATVRQWASDPMMAGRAVEALDRQGSRWAESLFTLIARSRNDERYWSAISSGVTTALAWLDDPVLADLACPRPGEEFDAAAFIRDRGTAYLIGADSPHNPLSPYFACLASHLWSTAKRMAADPAEVASCKLRLDPPLMMVIDEPAITCPVPLGRWATEAGGHGIVLVTGFQSRSQLPARWGEHGGQALMDCITVKMMFGGVTDPEMLRMASGWGGVKDTWDHTVNPDKSRTKTPRQEPAFPEEKLRLLPLGQAFVVHRNTRAFIADIRPVHDHPAYQRATGSDFPAPWRAPITLPALEPPQPREAIPMPAAPATPPAIEDSEDSPAPFLVPDFIPAPSPEEASWQSPRQA
jgi:type IV secretion system protein VirD4